MRADHSTNPLPISKLATGFVILLAILAWAPAAMAGEPFLAPVDFNKQIRPILTQYCSACHGGVKQAGDVSFVYPEQVLPPDGWVIQPGDPEASVLIERIKSDDPETRMPPPGEHPDPVPADKIQLLERWIAEGAKWGDPWSLAPLQEPTARRPSSWARRPLDLWVQSRLQQEQLTASKAAPPAEWLRRVALDLTGLPPTSEQTESFVIQCALATEPAQLEAAYARQVDRLLADEHFGERWASLWMDLARYADSKGFEKDPHRDMWPYRDWLVRAFNNDMPYDEFTIKQLAGDLLPAPTADDLIATAFHRNTQTNTEGGTDDEEFRVAAVIDRLSTTWTVWQATTFACVQCHAHPYDPFKHEEFYACLALFNNTLDVDLDNDYPTLRIPAQWQSRDAAIATQRHYQSLRHQRNEIGAELAGAVTWHAITPTSAETTEGRVKIVGDFVRSDGGTFPVGVRYTIAAAAVPMTALRIEILPLADDPASWPEQGAVLSRLQLARVDGDGHTTPLEIADVFVDALTGPDDPNASLDDDSPGVGGYPKLAGPREAYFVLKQRWTPAAADQLRLVMTHSASTTGNIATPIRNFRWSVSNDDRWLDISASDQWTRTSDALQQAKQAVAAIDGVELPVLATLPPQVQRPTRLFVRGNWLDRGDLIAPGIPHVFASRGEPREVTNRLQLAQWLVSSNNPLAARVWANRIWEQLFGLGLVETLEDFGSSGLQPSHPELLDHLAIGLRDRYRWHLKPFLREIVLSSTYRQTNKTSQALHQRDPENRLLARGPRTRLSAEMVRDQALAVSGLMTEQIGGPSVMPPQPDGVWQTVYSGAQWDTAEGPQRYRRGLYTYWRRTSPYPSFLMFDSPTRDLCSARRIATNTPLQALVTLNDPVYVECGEALVRRGIATCGESPKHVIAWIYHAVTQQLPNQLESTELQSLYSDLRRSPPEPGVAQRGVDVAAMTIVANTILNLDKALTK